MKKIKYICLVIIALTCSLHAFSQVENDSGDTINLVPEVSGKELVHFANNGELISEVQSLNLHIKIYKVQKGLIGVDQDFLSKDFDLYIAVSTINQIEKLYIVKDMYNVRDVRWLGIDEVPEFRCNYAGSSHTRTARFKIYSKKIERLY